MQAEIDNLRHLAALLADPAPVAAPGRLLAASRPLPVLGLRAASAQARGFAYFARKVHPDVRLLDEGGTMLADRIDAAERAGRHGAAVLRAAPASAGGRGRPRPTPRRRA